MSTADKQSADNGDGHGEQGQFVQGNGGGPGRPRGKPNKVTAMLKDDILQAYQERGGIKWLGVLPNRDFVRLLEKVMPKEIAADIKTSGDLHVSVNVGRYAPLAEPKPQALASTPTIAPQGPRLAESEA